MEQNCSTWLSTLKFNFLARDSLRILSAFLTSSCLGERLKFAYIFAIREFFLDLLSCFSCKFVFAFLLHFHSKTVYLRRSYCCKIISININWDKLDLKKCWVNSTKKLISFFNIPLNSKHAIKLHKNWKTWLSIL